MVCCSWAASISLFSALGAFLFGLDIGYIASILECPGFKRDVGHLANWRDPKSSIDSSTCGFIVGVFSIGCVISASPFCSPYFIDHWGRKSSITLGTFVFLLGCLLQVSAMSVFTMAAGRLISGMSIGLLSAIVPMYQSELAPPSSRGALTSLYQLMITFGILVAVLLNYGFLERDNGWRLVILLQGVPALALLFGSYCMPRSPRWLVQQGRDAEARDVLLFLRADETEASKEFEEIRHNHEFAKSCGTPCWGELCRGRLSKLVTLGIAMQLLQQLVGMNAFMYFGPRIFQQSGLDPLLFQALSGAVNFLATFPAIFLADLCGRPAC
jgi:SP family sugar:H+ symporter-like MFS transporter